MNSRDPEKLAPLAPEFASHQAALAERANVESSLWFRAWLAGLILAFLLVAYLAWKRANLEKSLVSLGLSLAGAVLYGLSNHREVTHSTTEYGEAAQIDPGSVRFLAMVAGLSGLGWALWQQFH